MRNGLLPPQKRGLIAGLVGPQLRAAGEFRTPPSNPKMFDPGLHLPFTTYRRFVDGKPVVADLAPTLIHHYESEKFRGTDEDLRLAVLDATTVHAARKISKRHILAWRKDWKAVRSRVFGAGIAMQAVHLHEAMRLARAAYERSIEIAALPRVHGLPGSFIAATLQSFFEQVAAKDATRLGFATLEGHVPADIDARLSALFGRRPPFSAAIYVGDSADGAVELWCARNAVPVRHVGASIKRLRAEDAPVLLERVTHLVACLPPLRKATSQVKLAARKAKVQYIDLCFKVPPTPR